MAPAARPTQRPVNPAPVPAPTAAPARAASAPAAPAQPAAASVQAAATLDSTGATAQGASTVPPEQGTQPKEHRVFDPGNITRWDLGIGAGFVCKNFNNGVDALDDHCGEYFELNPKHRLHLDEPGRHRLNLGLYWRKDWESRDIPVAEGLKPDTSSATSDALGVSAEYMFGAVPTWLSLGGRLKLGYVEYNSEQGQPNPDTGEYPRDRFGVVVNANGEPTGRGASSYPWDGASGADIGLGLAIGTLNEALMLRGEVNFNPGVSMEVNTVTQGSFSQPVNPTGYSIGLELNVIAAGEFVHGLITGKKKQPAPARRSPASATPAPAPTPVSAPAAAAAARTEPTVADRMNTLGGYQSAMEALVLGSPDGRVKGNRQIEQEIKDVIATPASVVGGQEAKNARVAELATRSNAQAAGAQALHAQAMTEKAALEQAITQMPEGEEKKSAQASLRQLEAKMVELVNGAYSSYEKVAKSYKGYARKNPGTPEVEFDVERPAPAPQVQARRSTPARTARATRTAPAASPAPAPAATAAPAPAASAPARTKTAAELAGEAMGE